jgi:hypothetical protein
MERNVKLSFEDYEKCEAIYMQFSQVILENAEIEYAVPIGADKILHERSLRTESYEKYCVNIYGGRMHHNSEYYGTERFWNAWSNTCKGFQKKFGLSVEKESRDGNYLLDPSECVIMKSRCL